MRFVHWLQEQGYESRGLDLKEKKWIKPKNISSIVSNALCIYLVKGDSVFIYGLGQVGYPPHLLSPILPEIPLPKAPVTPQVISSGIIERMECQEAFDALYPLSLQPEWIQQFLN